MISFWQYHRVEGTAAGGIIFPGRYGLNREVRIAGEPGIQISRATTSEITNPSFETNTTGWNNVGTVMPTFERSTARSLFGAASLHCVSDNTGDIVNSDLLGGADAGVAYTVSCWVYVVYGDFKLQLISIPAATSEGSATVTTTGSWQFVSVTATMPGGSTDARLRLTPNAIAASEFYVDGCQGEALGYPTSYCDGSLASDGAQGVGGHSWTGTAHASTSARTAASLYWPTASLGLLPAPYTVSFYWRPGFASTVTTGVNHYLFSDGTRYIYWDGTNKTLVAQGGNGFIIATPTPVFSAYGLLHIVLTANGTLDTLYVNGVNSSDVSNTTYPAWGTNIYIGSDSSSANQGNGVFAHLSIYNTAKSAADIAAMYTQGPGPFTGCVFYAPLTDSIHGEAGTCISLDRLSTGPYLRFGNWHPTVPVQTALGIESFERDGVDLEVQKYGNVTENMLLHFQNVASPDTGIKDVKRLGSILHTARMWSESSAKGQPGTEAVDLIYRPTGIGRLGRSRVLGWGNSAMTPEQFEFLVSKGRGDVSLSFVREPFWRCAERALGNGPTTVNTWHDGTHENYTAIAGDPTWIEGEIPAPAAVWLKNTTANTYARVVAALIQDRRGDAVTPVPWLDAKDQASNAAGAYHNGTAEAADASAASGTRVTINPSITDYSLQFDGYDSYLTTPDAAVWALDTAAGDFTIEFWIYITNYASSTTDTQRILDHTDSTGGVPDYRGWMLSVNPSIGFHLNFYTGSSTNQISGGVSLTIPSLNQWHHVAVCYSRNSANIVTRRWFIDGKKSSEFALAQPSVAADSAGALTVGRNATPNYTFFRLDELRISNSIRYTDDFVVPTAAFATDGNTLGLWHFNEGTLVNGNTTDNAETTASRDFTLTNFSVTASDNNYPGVFSVLVAESSMADYDIPLTMTEQYAGQMVAWGRMKVPSGGAVANVTARSRWNVTNGSFWSVDNKRPSTANQWEWVELGTIQIPWFPVGSDWIEAGAMDVAALTDTNRQFSIYTTAVTTADDLYLDAFLFLPKSSLYANVNGCNMGQNQGLLINWMGRKPFIGKTGTNFYTPVFEAQLDPVSTALQVWPGRQAWLTLLIMQASGVSTITDTISVYPLRYRPLYLELPVDE